MKKPLLTLIWFVLCATALARVAPVLALETDQFTVPKRPLPDLGPEIDVYVAATVWDVAQDMNARAAVHERKARSAAWPFKDFHRARAARYREVDFLAKRVFDALAGPGLPESRIEQWVRRHRFRAAGTDGTARFDLPLARCVYGDSVFSKPLLLAFLSPTVNIHGTYTGVDKLGHVFQHGFHYYEEYRREEARGGDDARATARAVRIGVWQERGFYGETTTGVYSNADLAANFAGLKFYLNLTRQVNVGATVLPPLLLRDRAGAWSFNPDRRPDEAFGLLIGDHFNEALNPSRFSFMLRSTVRERLKPRATRLIAFYGTTPERERERLEELSTWNGQPYGHSGFGGVVTILDHCPPVRESDGGVGSGAITAAGRILAPADSESPRRTSPSRLSIR